MLKNALICDNCRNEIETYYFSKALDICDMIGNVMYGGQEFDDGFDDEQLDAYLSKYNSIIEYKPQNEGKNSKEIQNSVKKINVKNIYNKVTKKVIGQDEPVKFVLSTLIRNASINNPYIKSNIFLIGGTGIGKSETIKQIVDELGLVYVLEDASKYTQEGYVGESVENAIAKLIDAAGGDITKAEHGVIIFDEIDKKTDNGDRSGVSTTSVQDSLLKMLEGTIISTSKGRINTKFITFVLIGACEEAYKVRKERLNEKRIGFKSVDNDTNAKSESKNPKFIPEDLIKAGFKAELIGRMDNIQEFNAMTLDMAKKIINDSEISIFNFYIEEFRKMGIIILMPREEIVNEIAKRAIELKTGARAIRQIVVEMFKNIYAESILLNRKPNSIYYCHIDKEIVYDNTKFKLCKKEERN